MAVQSIPKCTMPPIGWACTRGAGHDGPCAAIQVPTLTGWASPSLGRAYFEVEQVRDAMAQPVESGIDEALRAALDAIEAADVAIEPFS